VGHGTFFACNRRIHISSVDASVRGSVGIHLIWMMQGEQPYAVRTTLERFSACTHGLSYARSAAFLQTGVMDTLRWLRVIDDTIFALGALALGWFILGLKTGWSLREPPQRPDLASAHSRP